MRFKQVRALTLSKWVVERNQEWNGIVTGWRCSAQFEGHRQSLNLGGFKRWGAGSRWVSSHTGAMIGQTLPARRRLHSAIVQVATTTAALLMYARDTHRVHWPTYSLFPRRVMAYQNWRGSSPVGRTLAWALITVIRAPISRPPYPPCTKLATAFDLRIRARKSNEEKNGSDCAKAGSQWARGQNVGAGTGLKRRGWHFIITSWYQWKPHLQGFFAEGYTPPMWQMCTSTFGIFTWYLSIHTDLLAGSSKDFDKYIAAGSRVKVWNFGLFSTPKPKIVPQNPK